MRTYIFYKDEIGWFIDLKWFPFNRAHLAMVCGADELLDKLSNNGEEIYLEISTKPIKNNHNCLYRIQKLGIFNGAVYEPSSLFEIEYEIFKPNQLWLCAVTLFVFGHYPEKIYFRVKTVK